MAYKMGQRNQMRILPETIEDYVRADDPVRAYDAFVAAINLEKIGIKIKPWKVGCPEYDPVAMLKLLIYSYSYGWRSSRKMERACYHNVSFIWLMGGLKPDHKTIAEFRRNNKGALKTLMKQCARMCIDLGLIEGNTLFTDGTKMRANASINSIWDKDRCMKNLKRIEEEIEKILDHSEQTDGNEDRMASLVKMDKELKDQEKMKVKIDQILKKLEAEEKKERGKKGINIVDEDCVKVKGRQGTHSGYNGQITTDEKHGLIVNSDVVSEANDFKQLANQIEQTQAVLGKQCKKAVGDSGYSNSEEIAKLDKQGINIVVPTTEQAAHKKKKEDSAFSKDKFIYEKETDTYVCPEGKRLKYKGKDKKKRQKEYKAEKAKNCQMCKHFGTCTRSKSGRRIKRLYDEEARKKAAIYYETEEGQKIYALRQQRVEHPFGHIKRNLGAGYFLLRGREGVNAEFSVLSAVFNIRRMITILGGVCQFVDKMAA
jgi:transposase